MSGLLENITNPALLFFILGIIAVQCRNDLEIPDSSSKFISIYLLFCIGFKGGNELAHSSLNLESVCGLGIGFLLAATVPLIAFLILKKRIDTNNAGAIAAAYGSVSAVTFVTAISFLEFEGVSFSGYMIAVMALMEAPAIIVGILLIRMYSGKSNESKTSIKKVINHAINNASVFLILGSLVIGFLVTEQQAEGVRPFTTDLFKGFLALFLLDMGIRAGRHLNGIKEQGFYFLLFAAVFPFVNGLLAILLASLITTAPGNLLLFAILGAGASYIAVPAAFKNAVPEANPGIYLPMALGITFPVNIIIGIPFYYAIINQIL